MKIIDIKLLSLLGLFYILIVNTGCRNGKDKIYNPEDLTGAWFRYSSGGDEYDDRMYVRVEESWAIVDSLIGIDSIDFDFQVGDTIWQDITSITSLRDSEHFSIDQLGSDGDYYNSTITVTDATGDNPEKIRIRLSTTTDKYYGYFQYWERY